MSRPDHIDIHIASDDDMNQAFIHAWKRGEQGGQPPEEQHHLYFEDAASLLKVLSSQRLRLLSTLLRLGPGKEFRSPYGLPPFHAWAGHRYL
jgi:predicted transcriptional regulator